MFTTSAMPRFHKTDALDHVKNTVISAWFETAREPIFRIFSPEIDVREISITPAKVEVNVVAQIQWGDDFFYSLQMFQNMLNPLKVIHITYQ